LSGNRAGFAAKHVMISAFCGLPVDRQVKVAKFVQEKVVLTARVAW
jgi:hypothetical protein